MHACTRKHAHTDQYIILIAFLQQQWFSERASVLRYTYIACLVELSLVTNILPNYKVRIKHRFFLQYKSLCKMLYSFVIKPEFKDGERRVVGFADCLPSPRVNKFLCFSSEGVFSKASVSLHQLMEHLES